MCRIKVKNNFSQLNNITNCLHMFVLQPFWASSIYRVQNSYLIESLHGIRRIFPPLSYAFIKGVSKSKVDKFSVC